MMRSMYSGVSGLQAHQSKMDIIGNNIANVNTVGYKSQRVTFNEVFSQTLQSGTSASDETGRGGRNPMQVGLGVNVSSIDMLMTQGAAQRTDNPFDLMISGDGFIIVGDDSGKYFTRAGALRQDDQGNLVIPNGMKVQGWQPSEDGKSIVKGQVDDIKLNDPKNMSTPPSTTKKTTLSGNLDLNEANIDKDGDGVVDEKATGIPQQIKMYDSLGNLYSMNVYLVYSPDDIAGTGIKKGWNIFNSKSDETPPKFENVDMQLTDTDGNKYTLTNKKFPGAQFTFDATGKITKPTPPATLSVTIPQIDLTGAKPSLNASIGDKDKGVIVDFSGLTQYASKTNIESKTADGGPAGQMTGFDVGGDGKITAYYNNGATKLLGQIVLAEFDNPAGLEKVGDNLFKTTANSGEFDSIGTAGNFQAGVLEMSNVDLSREFTEMIVTQRGFQANSRIISTSDEMLQELVNIKR